MCLFLICVSSYHGLVSSNFLKDFLEIPPLCEILTAVGPRYLSCGDYVGIGEMYTTGVLVVVIYAYKVSSPYSQFD